MTPTSGSGAVGFSGIEFGAELGRRLNALEALVKDKSKLQFDSGTLSFPPSNNPTQANATFHHIDFSKPVRIELAAGSTEGVIYYLGEVVRRQLNPDYGDLRRTISIQYGPLDQEAPFPLCLGPGKPNKDDRDKYYCEPLFVVEHGKTSSDAFIAVDYDGGNFFVPRDNTGRTNQALDLVTQLIATNKSAKDLPATSVFTVISPP